MNYKLIYREFTMFKKILVSIITLMSALTLTACGSNSSDKSSSSSSKPVKVAVPKSEPKYTFKNGVATLHDLKIEITSEKIIQPGQTGNEYGKKPVIAFWYKTTNFTDKKIDPSTAWIAVFKAIQDNSKNSVNTLNVGSLPDNKFLDSQSQTIKKNGTVENAISYELTDLKTPVTLVATQGVDGNKLGQQVFELTK